jgi:hypothetical protein
MKGITNVQTMTNNKAASGLPKPVLDRIHRYAKEGWAPRTRYGHDGCLLLASSMGRVPVVILRSTRKEFSEIRSAALVEWMRFAPALGGRNGRKRSTVTPIR